MTYRSCVSEALSAHPANECNSGGDGSSDEAAAHLSALLKEEKAACASDKSAPAQQQAIAVSGGWCEEEGLLARIFNGFPHLQISSSQEQVDITRLAQLFQHFTAFLKKAQSHAKGLCGAPLWSNLPAASLQALVSAAAILTSTDRQLQWFPQYGSAILAMPLGTGAVEATGSAPDIRARLTPVALTLMGLDKWEFAPHSSLGAFGCTVDHSAVCGGHCLITCGTIEANDYALEFPARLAKIEMEHAKLLKKKSGPRTPGYLHALVVAALRGEDASGVKVRGGVTDVGQHQGFNRRDTCWPLVREVLKMCLEQDVAGTQAPAYLFDQALAYFQLWLCTRQAQLIGSQADSLATPSRISACMHMLHTAAAASASLAEDGHDMVAFEMACLAIRQRLGGAVAARADAIATTFQLPSDIVRNSLSAYRLPHGVLPRATQPAGEEGGLAAARSRADENLGSLPMLPCDASISYRQLLSAIQMPTWSNAMDSAAAQLALRSVERELFSQTRRGFNALMLDVSDDELAALESVVDEYRSLLHRFLDTEAGRAGMRVELLSRELLVVWVMYCLMHAAARQRHSAVMSSTGVALQWQDLRHLVLSDKEAVDAALAVAAYLHQHTQPDRELFSQRHGGCATFKMAQEFARLNPQMMTIWRDEQGAAAKREGEHWKEVQRKQREAAALRLKLGDLEQRRSQTSQDKSNEYRRTARYQQLGALLNSLDSEICSTQQVLTCTEAAPPPVIQPLPQGEPQALSWLFFLHMPPMFRHLSRASFLAQQMLLPQRPSDHALVWEPIKVKPWETSLVGHYNTSRGNTMYGAQAIHDAGADGCVSLHSRHKIPTQVGPSHVDSFASTKDGVWYPDSLLPSMAWKGSGSAVDAALGLATVGYFDPFLPTQQSVVELYFTEGGSAPHQLQWAMHTRKDRSSTPSDRGNLAISKQADKPSWLSKPGFLALGTLRSYPLGQMHRLCDLLHQREVPLHRPEVITLVRQAVFHIGTLGFRTSEASTTSPMELLWRTDWQPGAGKGGDVLATLCYELQQLAEELDQTPRDHDAVLLLGELAAYFSMWHAPCKGIARLFADMTRRVAEEMEGGIAAAAAAEGSVQQQLQARQCQLRMLSLLCHGPGALDTYEDAAAVVQLMVQIKHGHIFLDRLSKQESDKLKALHARCHNVTARYAEALVWLATTEVGQQLLTAAVACVLQRTPATLRWTRLDAPGSGMSSGSFEAVDAEGHLYSVNMLNGTVLLDGSPPGRLPRGVLDHPLYRRVFEDRNFEVARTSAGVLKTLKPVNQRFYDFCLEAERLTVIETDDQGLRLELLDVGQDQTCGEWGSDLPLSLRELYSHWLCRQQGVILLRPRAFQEHTYHLIMTVKAAESEAQYEGEEEGGGEMEDRKLCQQQQQQQQQYTCWRVPPHLQQLSRWLDLLGSKGNELTDQLVLPDEDSHVKRVLSKMERPQLIHTFLSTSSSSSNGSSARTHSDKTHAALPGQHVLLWELPRYKLSFYQDAAGPLVSRDYHGYQLAQCQQLVASLLDPSPQLPTAGLPGKSEQNSGKDRTVGMVCSPQGLWYTLPGFQQYMVLERGAGLSSHTSSCARRADLLVLVPVGEVQHSQSGAARSPETSDVHVVIPENVDAAVEVHSYEVHPRFGDLRASSKLARLQLAALYAATSTLLPEPLSKRTGSQMAMQLLRQCWGNSPLAPQEHSLLDSVAQLGGHLAAGLMLLVRELHLSATQLAHLHPAAPQQTPALNPDDGTSYLSESSAGLFQGWCGNPHILLTDAEEIRSMGGVRWRVPRAAPDWFRSGSCRTLEVPACPVDACFVERAEREVMKAVALRHPKAVPAVAQAAAVPQGRTKMWRKLWPKLGPSSTPKPYPLQPGAAVDLPLKKEMDQELRRSWDAFCCSPKPSVAVSPDKLLRQLSRLQDQTQAHRAKAEAYLMHSLSLIPAGTNHGTAYRMLRHSGAIPWPTLLDLAACYAEDTDNRLRSFNPFLSDASCGRLRDGISTWLQLCVLEDRVERLQALLEAGEEMQPVLVRELLVHRTWDPKLYPEWLVLEAEGQLQIRPNQHWIAKHLISSPGTIDQLNMGEGKTRVIMPMLVLYWTRHKEQVVRLHLLSSLLDEAHGYLQRFMCASVLGRKIFTLPFHRGVEISEQGAKAMKACLQYCQQVGGILLVAPEQRASLHLKWHELRAKGESGVCSALDGLAALPYQDLLDESDELLHHRFQLVYACGSASSLPAFRQRASAVQALLHLVSDNAETWLDKALWTSSQSRRPGSFCGLRLLPGQALDAALLLLHTKLAVALMNNPPYELRWMKDHPIKDEIARCMLEGDKDALPLLGPDRGGLTDDQVDHVLAVRGMLSSGLLVHGLQKRYLVEYGVNRSTTARKNLAVPFRAAHTPSERSEFAQPDVALLLTTLAYYHDGLNPDQMLQALQKLLGFGQSAKEHHYAEWFKLSSDKMDAGDPDALDMVSKLDPSNAQQLELLFRYYSHNMAVIDFWLNYCVLPTETQQYPQRLAASSWHLAENARGAVVGFSGTNDNHRLLPLQVRQELQPEEPSLMETNGKMLAVVMDHTKGYSTLKGDKPTCEALLDEALALKLDAILDCGALLAGTSNKHAAEYLLKHLDSRRHRGVGFFDDTQRTWMVLEAGGRCLPRHASPVADSHAFVIYDDARCRGADLQLRPSAVGLLTLGPAICKDKMMQAAGRLRMLGRGQKLHFVATADVTAKIRSNSSMGPEEAPTSVHVLQWVRDNTVQATQNGVMDWSKQGLSFAATFERPEAVMENEVLELQELYDAGRSSQLVPCLVKNMSRHTKIKEALDGSDTAVRRMQVVEGVVSRAQVMGSGHEVVVGTALEEECERELEHEEEEEQEVEQEVPRVKPAMETDWLFNTVLDAGSLQDIDTQAKPTLLSEQLASMHMDMLRHMDWAPQLFCTANYIRTAADGAAVQKEYLRPVKALLLFPDRTVLLVSEREADALLELRWGTKGGLSSSDRRSAAAPLLITSLAYAQLAAEGDQRSTPQRLAFILSTSPQGVTGSSALLQPGVKELVSMLLFDGGTQYRTPEQQQELHRLMRRKKKAAEALTEMRGKQSMLPCSHLELACEDVLYVTA